MTDEETDLIARYLALRLSLLLESKQYRAASTSQLRKWQEQLEETKRELVANGLAIQD